MIRYAVFLYEGSRAPLATSMIQQRIISHMIHDAVRHNVISLSHDVMFFKTMILYLKTMLAYLKTIMSYFKTKMSYFKTIMFCHKIRAAHAAALRISLAGPDLGRAGRCRRARACDAACALARADVGPHAADSARTGR